jgi:hypothetical protein
LGRFQFVLLLPLLLDVTSGFVHKLTQGRAKAFLLQLLLHTICLFVALGTAFGRVACGLSR